MSLTETITLEREPLGDSWVPAAVSSEATLEAEVAVVHPLVGGKEVAPRRVALFLDPDSEDTPFWLALCPTLDSITTQGLTREEALLNAQDMVSLYLEFALENGEMVPASDVNRFLAEAA